MEQKSRPVKREQCPICLDSGHDNLITYADGGTYCFACGTNPLKEEKAVTNETNFIETGLFLDIPERKITKQTCIAYNYQIATDAGNLVHVANYFDSIGTLVGQKIRTKDKKFYSKGDVNGLFGSWKYESTDKLFVTVTEGEIDALSVGQVMGTQWPVVSLSMGAGMAAKQIKTNLQYLLGFKYVVLAFDNDDAGRKATEECIRLFPMGKVKVANWPLKDANEMLIAGRDKEINETIWNAKEVKPEYLVTVEDIIDKVLEKPKKGFKYPWPSMTDITYGFQSQEINIIVGATGVGKTEVVKELILNYIQQGLHVGLFSFEQSPAKSIHRLIGAALQQKLHVPGSEWDNDKIREEAMKFNNKLYLCESAGSLNDTDLINSIRFWAKAKEVKLIIIDNMKGLAHGGGDEVKHIKQMMLTFQTLARELDISFLLVSHVAKDKYSYSAHLSTKTGNSTENKTAEEVQKMMKKTGLEWESGRMPSKENIEGTGAVADLADNIFAIARNITSDNPIEQKITRVRCLKTRINGSNIGKEFKLIYTDTGTLKEFDQQLPDELSNTAEC